VRRVNIQHEFGAARDDVIQLDAVMQPNSAAGNFLRIEAHDVPAESGGRHVEVRVEARRRRRHRDVLWQQADRTQGSRLNDDAAIRQQDDAESRIVMREIVMRANHEPRLDAAVMPAFDHVFEIAHRRAGRRSDHPGLPGIDPLVHHSGSAPNQARDQRDDEQNDEDEEQDLRDFGRARGDAAKSEQRGDESNNEKDECVTEHGGPRFGWFQALRAERDADESS